MVDKNANVTNIKLSGVGTQQVGHFLMFFQKAFQSVLPRVKDGSSAEMITQLISR